jgi:ElaA protein
MITWRLARFDDLSPREVHDIFRARIEVFVVEQKCVFQDLDGVDPECWHLLGTVPEFPERENRDCPRFLLVAYCRLVPPGTKFAEPSIGRVLTTGSARRSGAGRELMRRAVDHATRLWPGRALRIGAQKYLERFYGEFGFVTASEPYDEDGIPHVEMLRAASAIADTGARSIGR